MRIIDYSIEGGTLYYLDATELPEKTQERIAYRKNRGLPVPMITSRATTPQVEKAPDADIVGMIVAFLGMSGVIGGVTGVIFNGTAGLVLGSALAIILVISAIKDHPNAQRRLAEHNQREFTRDDFSAMRSGTKSLDLPRLPDSAGEKTSKNALQRRSREDQLLYMVKLATILKKAIVNTESWRTAYLDTHRGMFSPSADERQFIQHAIKLLLAYQKLGVAPEGSTTTALMAGEAYEIALRPLDLVRDNLIERITALDSYHRHLVALDQELANAATAKRALSIDDDLLELFQNTVGDEFATAQIQHLTENAQAMAGAVNELVEALNRDLHTLVALAPREKTHAIETRLQSTEPEARPEPDLEAMDDPRCDHEQAW
ncbi:hypothetical protein [Rhodococcus sp. BP22]|uniref:hypothetical protein n=1 Tax=Rhodococcus sp. BP22 TaxID=2758566 RepID=UPI0016461AB7|nr:hypothetical protein [Rhodococcus sp. BP22]